MNYGEFFANSKIIIRVQLTINYTLNIISESQDVAKI